MLDALSEPKCLIISRMQPGKNTGGIIRSPCAAAEFAIMASRVKMARWSFSKHRLLALIGGISLLVWGISGLAHIAMVLFGPQQTVFMPPVRALNLQGSVPIEAMLAAAGIEKPTAIRTVAGREGNLIQVTLDPKEPRRYFVPATGRELPDHDRQQAEFLARHYLKEARPVASTALQNAFDGDYPWVNRLMPVWRVQFEGDDRLTAYIYTETSSLAAVNNCGKSVGLWIFRHLHTWEWVPPAMKWLRIVVMTIMVGSLLALAVTGITMLITIRRKKRVAGSKGLHRAFGYVLALPLIMFSASGIYHLVHRAFEQPVSQLAMARPLDMANNRFPIAEQWDELTRGLRINSLSLVEGADGEPLYRLGIARGPSAAAKGEHHHGGRHVADRAPATAHQIRDARFTGLDPADPAVYISALSGKAVPERDQRIARMMAGRYSGLPDHLIAGTTLVTSFSPEYDFRNKRLPVWRVDYGAPSNASYFIDTITGSLADKVENWQKPERYIFSFIHKWNFLHGLGWNTLNIIVGCVAVALIVFMGGIGLWLRKAGRRTPQAGSHNAP